MTLRCGFRASKADEAGTKHNVCRAWSRSQLSFYLHLTSIQLHILLAYSGINITGNKNRFLLTFVFWVGQSTFRKNLLLAPIFKDPTLNNSNSLFCFFHVTAHRKSSYVSTYSYVTLQSQVQLHTEGLWFKPTLLPTLVSPFMSNSYYLRFTDVDKSLLVTRWSPDQELYGNWWHKRANVVFVLIPDWRKKPHQHLMFSPPGRSSSEHTPHKKSFDIRV